MITRLLPIVLVSFFAFTVQMFASYISVPPVCTPYEPKGSGVFFPGDTSQLSYDACSGDGLLEYGYAKIYTYLDHTPCGGDCVGTYIGCTSGCCNSPNPEGAGSAHTIDRVRHELRLSGDVGNGQYGVNAGASGNNIHYEEAGTFNVGGIDRISLYPLGKLENGTVTFRYLVLAKEWKANDDCSVLIDPKYPERMADNCSFTLSEEQPIFSVSGTFNVMKNERTDFDLFNLQFSVNDAIDGIASIKPVYYGYKSEPYKHTVNRGSWNPETCDCEPLYDTFYLLTEDQAVTYRVKVPSWSQSVWAQWGNGDLAPYMGIEGWSSDVQKKHVNVSLGSFGVYYFHCSIASDDSAKPERFLLSHIEHCESWQVIGQGRKLWSFAYEKDNQGKKHLSYIYNGTDPNCPEQSPVFYRLTWSPDYLTVQQEYYNTAIDQSPLRVWNASFDTSGRVVQSYLGCSSGCGSSSYGYEKVEYNNQYENYDDLIKRKYNAAGDVVLENEYRVFRYGDNWPAYSITVQNESFESPDVEYGYFQTVCPNKWVQNDPNVGVVRVYEPNQIQWSSRYGMGESVPDRNQILTLLGGTIQQSLPNFGIINTTTYLLEADTGAFIDPNNSQATIKLLAYDPNNPSGPTEELIVIDVDENSAPAGDGTQLEQGRWVTQGAIWDSSNTPELSGWRFRIEITGDFVDIDRLSVTAVTFVGGETKPLLISQKANPVLESEPNVLFATWDYNPDNYTAVERRWVDNQNARIIKYQYTDGTFGDILSKTEYEDLNDSVEVPSGRVYTTSYRTSQENSIAGTILTEETLFPNGKKKAVQRLQTGKVIESYTQDVQTGKRANCESYTYFNNNMQTHTDVRNGVTEYTYNELNLLTEQKAPITSAGRHITQYGYDGARRMIWQKQQDASGTWILTRYNYNSNTGMLDSVVVDDNDYLSGRQDGKKITTSYVYNDFGQVTREISPDGVVAGKSYGLGGELKSEFIIDPNCSPALPDEELMLISQTCYYYNSDGKLEFVKKVKNDERFSYSSPNDQNETLPWVVTQYQYDFLGRRTAVIEDVGGLNLKTEYQYNNQGEVEKTIFPNGKWTRIFRDGRGLTVMQVEGHDNLPESQWQVTQYSYDENGNVIQQVTSDSISEVYEYDSFDRVIRTVKQGVK